MGTEPTVASDIDPANVDPAEQEHRSDGRLPSIISRRNLIRGGGLVAGAVAATSLLKASESLPHRKSTATSAASAASVVSAETLNIKAHELGDLMLFDVDRLAVKAGEVTFNFTTSGRMPHELFVYPVQDVSRLMAMKRAGQPVGVLEHVRGLVASTVPTTAGRTVSFSKSLAPGFYELACCLDGRAANGSSLQHFDGAQSVTFAVVGNGGPHDSVVEPSSSIAVHAIEGVEPLQGSSLFVPDRLITKAGDVTFRVTNGTGTPQDFLVYPLGQVGAFIDHLLAGHGHLAEIDGAQLVSGLQPGAVTSEVKSLEPGWWVGASFATGQWPDGVPYVERDRGQRFTFVAV